MTYTDKFKKSAPSYAQHTDNPEAVKIAVWHGDEIGGYGTLAELVHWEKNPDALERPGIASVTLKVFQNLVDAIHEKRPNRNELEADLRGLVAGQVAKANQLGLNGGDRVDPLEAADKIIADIKTKLGAARQLGA